MRSDARLTPRKVLAETAAASASQGTADLLMPLAVLLLGTSCVTLL